MLFFSRRTSDNEAKNGKTKNLQKPNTFGVLGKNKEEIFLEILNKAFVGKSRQPAIDQEAF